MENDNNDRLKPDKWDIAHLITKAGLSAFPIVGGPAAELFSSVITPPLSRRRDKWISEIASRLQELEKSVEGFRVEELADNDVFITALLNASQIAIRNHQEEKLMALRNAIINTAIKQTIEEDWIVIFLNLIDTLTSTHFLVLDYYNKTGKYLNNAYNSHRNEVLIGDIPNTWLLPAKYVFPEYDIRKDYYSWIRNDLFNRGLSNNADALFVVYEIKEINYISSLTSERIRNSLTDLGKDFINFIDNPQLGNKKRDVKE